jgi:hypothetical protein
MKSLMKNLVILTFLLCASLPSMAQIDIRVYEHQAWTSPDTIMLIIDPNDNSGTGGGEKTIFFNVYNTSHTQSEAFFLEAEWLCSNSSAFYQFCQQYPPDYNSGTCHTFHREGQRSYADYNYSIPPDTCGYNYLQCYFKVFDYSIEPEHEKVCRFRIIRKNTLEVLDSVYLIIRRGNLPCNGAPTDIRIAAADEVANIYPNPARNTLTITAGQEEWTSCALYSIDGKQVWNANPRNKKTAEVNVANLSSGVYYVKVTDRKGKAFYKKILVDH